MTPVSLLLVLAPIIGFLILRRWRLGLYLLLGYLPVSGVPILLFFPSTLPVLFKDILFVIPLYLAYFLGGRNNRAWQYVPRNVMVAVVVLVLLVLIQALNPNGYNWLVAAIGVKVWLSYIPLMLVATIFFFDDNDRVRLLRLMVVMAWIPCTVGILQWLGSVAIGYRDTMEMVYGEMAAEASTQGFTEFDVTGQFFRIPSTFSYPTQYFGFILCTITACYIALSIDASRRWRKFTWATWALAIVAGLLCGARSAYLLIPLLLAFTFWFSGRVRVGLAIALMLPTAGLLAGAIGGFDIREMLQTVFGLTFDYGKDLAFAYIKSALSDTVLGMGTGTNTGAARFAFEDPNDFGAYENYYAKIAYELGYLGLFVYVVFELVILWQGVKLLRASRGREADLVGALLAFFVTIFLNNFKGWQVDLDPVNVYFWVYLGLLWSVRVRARARQARAWGASPTSWQAAWAGQSAAHEARRHSGVP